ncbi:hypothetical protein JCM16303_001248 [Sporobolomyces ruberrimus]
MASSSAKDDLLYQLTHLPPTTNPFGWLETLVKNQYMPRYSSSASLQMYINIAIVELCVVLVLGSLFLRYRKNHLWFFRRQVNQLLIQPNIATVGSVLGLVFLTLTNILMFAVLRASSGKLPSYLGLLPGIAGEVVMWSIAASYLGHLHSTQSTKRPLGRWILASNILGILTPIVHFGSFLPLDIIAGRHYAHIVSLLAEIQSRLLSEAADWAPSSPFSLEALLPFVPIFAQLEREIYIILPLTRAIYIFHSVTTVVLIVLLTTIACLYLSSVNRLIRTAKREMLETQRSTELLDQIYQTWAGLVVVVILVDLIASAFLGFTIYTSVRPGGSSQTYVLTLFWTTSTLGLITVSVLFWLSWILVPAQKNDRRVNPTEDSFRIRVVRYRRPSRFQHDMTEHSAGSVPDLRMVDTEPNLSLGPTITKEKSSVDERSETRTPSV